MAVWISFITLAVTFLIYPKCECCMVYKSKTEGTLSDADNWREKRNFSLSMDSHQQLNPAGKDELSEARCKTKLGSSGEGLTSKCSIPRVTSAIETDEKHSRIEIHPKYEGKVTLTQIENECEESMRKQFKENQHKKKIEFNILEKRNDSIKEHQCKTSVKNNSKNYIDDSIEISKTNDCLLKERLSDRNSSKNEANGLLEPVKRWALADNITNNKNNLINKNKSDTEKIDLDKGGNDFKSYGSRYEINKNNKIQGNSSVNINNIEDQDVRLLKILSQDLNSHYGKFYEVEPLVQALKDITDKKMKINQVLFSENKPVSLKMDSNRKLKNFNLLLRKLHEYKKKHSDKNFGIHYGSSSLNPNLINDNNKENFSFLLKQPENEGTEHLLSNEKNKNVKLSVNSGMPPYYRVNTCESEFTLLPTLRDNGTENQGKSRNSSVFVNLVDKILNSINTNKSQADCLFRDLNKELIGNRSEGNCDRIVSHIIKAIANNDAKSSAIGKILKNEKMWQEKSRLARNVKMHRDKFLDRNKFKMTRVSNIPKRLNPTSVGELNSNYNKHNLKSNIAKFDELKRLQKVATDLKIKIDDLLKNIDGTVGIEEDDEDDDEEDDDDEDDELDDDQNPSPCHQSQLQSTISMQPSKSFSEVNKHGRINEDSYDSFRKFKKNEITSSLGTKTVGKKLQSNRANLIRKLPKETRIISNKNLKLKRDKRGTSESEVCIVWNPSQENVSEHSAGKRQVPYGLNYLNGSLSELKTQSSYLENMSNRVRDNNFNVFKVADMFKRDHKGLIDKQIHLPFPQDIYKKKFSNFQRNRRSFDENIQRNFETNSCNSAVDISSYNKISENDLNQGLKCSKNNDYNEKGNEIKHSNLNTRRNIAHQPFLMQSKNYKYQNCNKNYQFGNNYEPREQHACIARSLKHILQRLKFKKNKAANKPNGTILIKTISKHSTVNDVTTQAVTIKTKQTEEEKNIQKLCNKQKTENTSP